MPPLRRAPTPRRVLLLVLALSLTFPLGAGAQSLEQATAERETLEAELSAANAQLEEMEGQIAAREQLIADIDQQRAALTQQIEHTRESLTTRARSAFMHGDLGPVTAFISGDGVAEAIDRASAMELLARRDASSVEAAGSLRDQLQQLSTLRAAGLAELEGLRAQMQATSDQIAVKLERARMLEKAIKTRGERVKMVARGAQQGIYACPLQTPYNYIDSWGYPRSGGRSHKGTDIMAPYGNEVYAFTTGRVSRLSTSSLGGISLYLRGDDGVEYYYAHLSGYAPGISAGTRVEVGQLVAFNGATGNARGGSPHVHFEVHPGGGSPVNPYPWLRPVCI